MKYDEMRHELARNLFTLDDIDKFCLLHLKEMIPRVYKEELAKVITDCKSSLNYDLDTLLASITETGDVK